MGGWQSIASAPGWEHSSDLFDKKGYNTHMPRKSPSSLCGEGLVLALAEQGRRLLDAIRPGRGRALCRRVGRTWKVIQVEGQAFIVGLGNCHVCRIPEVLLLVL